MNRRGVIKATGVLLAAPLVTKAKPVKQSLLLQHSPVAGLQYYEGERVWPQFQLNQLLTLQREADNSYDKRAVAIHWNDAKLGYIPRRGNAAISQMLDRGEKLQVQIIQLNDADDYWKRMQVAVSVV